MTHAHKDLFIQRLEAVLHAAKISVSCDSDVDAYK